MRRAATIIIRAVVGHKPSIDFMKSEIEQDAQAKGMPQTLIGKVKVEISADA